MKYLTNIAMLYLLCMVPLDTQADSYFTCSNGNPLDFNGGHMIFNYANTLSADQKVALSLGHSRLTAFSDSSITAVDTGDDDFGPLGGQTQCVNTADPMGGARDYGNSILESGDGAIHCGVPFFRGLAGVCESVFCS